MYSIDDLLQLVYSEGLDELRHHVGVPPIVVVEGEHHTLDEPPIKIEDAEQLLHSIADTRQRRELAERGVVKFSYRFRRILDVLVCATIEDAHVGIDIQRQKLQQK
jgi:Tfp pilus assembly pilus retraction ATPase PilT